MSQLMRKLDIVQWAQKEVRALLRLSPWLLLSLLLAAVLWSADLATSSGLFQSPPELTPPTEPGMPGITPTLTLTPTLAPIVTPTLPPALTPTLTPTPTLEPIIEPTAVVSPTEAVEAGGPETAEEGQRYADEDTELSFDLSMLFDSVALIASYAWLCCGVLVFVSIPVVFAVLWVAGRRRARADEEQM